MIYLVDILGYSYNIDDACCFHHMIRMYILMIWFSHFLQVSKDKRCMCQFVTCPLCCPNSGDERRIYIYIFKYINMFALDACTVLRGCVTQDSVNFLLFFHSRFHTADCTSLLRKLKAQTLPDATPPIDQICPFSKIAVTFEPLNGFWCPSGFRNF